VWIRYLPPITDRILIEDALRPKMTYRTEIVGCSKVPRSVVKCKCEDASAIVMEGGPYSSYTNVWSTYAHGCMRARARARAYTRCVIYRWGWLRNGSYVETTAVGGERHRHRYCRRRLLPSAGPLPAIATP